MPAHRRHGNGNGNGNGDSPVQHFNWNNYSGNRKCISKAPEMHFWLHNFAFGLAVLFHVSFGD